MREGEKKGREDREREGGKGEGEREKEGEREGKGEGEGEWECIYKTWKDSVHHTLISFACPILSGCPRETCIFPT